MTPRGVTSVNSLAFKVNSFFFLINVIDFQKMPIIVKDYTWQETEGELIICLPLKGVSSTKVDIFSTDQYIKVSYPPYLFEVHLLKPVVEAQSTAKIGNGVITFRLIKIEPGHWSRLHSQESEDKDAMAEKRAEAVAHSQRADAELREERAKKKREEEQYAIQQQMKQEQEERGRIEREKQEERDRATKELEEWKIDEQRIREKVRQWGTPVSQQQQQQQRDDPHTEEALSVPPPRHTGKIQISFTPRAFTTPSRESKAELEEDYLARMAAARRIKDPEKKEEDINEKNPEFLKDRGIEFFKAENYQAAINVFSQAISLNDSLPHLFSNRAACYLVTGDHERCIADCSRALELFFPVVPSNYMQRAKAFARRGTAYANLAQLDLALQDYGAAVKLAPDDGKLKDDFERLKAALLSDTVR